MQKILGEFILIAGIIVREKNAIKYACLMLILGVIALCCIVFFNSLGIVLSS